MADIREYQINTMLQKEAFLDLSIEYTLHVQQRSGYIVLSTLTRFDFVLRFLL